MKQGHEAIKRARELGWTPQERNKRAVKWYYFDGPVAFTVFIGRPRYSSYTFTVGDTTTNATERAIELLEAAALAQAKAAVLAKFPKASEYATGAQVWIQNPYTTISKAYAFNIDGARCVLLAWLDAAKEIERPKDELLHKLYRIMAAIQVIPFRYGNDMIDALSFVMKVAEKEAGGYYQLQEWVNKNL